MNREELKIKFPRIQWTDSTATVEVEDLFAFASSLKKDFECLSSITGVDLPPDKIEVIYHLFSLSQHQALVIKTTVARDTPRLPSLIPIWPGANWHERETYDFLGVEFTDHPDLRRILTPEDLVGWPLRKDFTNPEFIPLPEVSLK